MSEYFIGLMSGTSLDGVDGVLVDFSAPRLRVAAQASVAFDADFRAELLSLNTPGHNELHRAARVGNRIASAYAQVVADLLHPTHEHGVQATDVCAVGAHGQTVRHQPQRVSQTADGIGYTLQLNNAALLAELCGIDVVSDFRARDIAAGGQGAPLVPAFHQSVFSQPDASVAVLNVGGISNVTVLPQAADTPVLGFDCGPGNALMDAWCQRHTGQAFDAAGVWAAGGHCVPELLRHLLAEAYFQQQPPKSTGRDLFSVDWLNNKLDGFASAAPQDVQTTLTEFTVRACVDCIERYAPDSQVLVVCGGGAYNQYLMQRLQACLPHVQVNPSDHHGLPPLQVEASAFAWLARQTVLRLPGNLPHATGACGPRILGAIYPA